MYSDTSPIFSPQIKTILLQIDHLLNEGKNCDCKTTMKINLYDEFFFFMIKINLLRQPLKIQVLQS